VAKIKGFGTMYTQNNVNFDKSDQGLSRNNPSLQLICALACNFRQKRTTYLDETILLKQLKHAENLI
jgi:hypothetical protein